jgi:hypothetical protein
MKFHWRIHKSPLLGPCLDKVHTLTPKTHFKADFQLRIDFAHAVFHSAFPNKNLYALLMYLSSYMSCPRNYALCALCSSSTLYQSCFFQGISLNSADWWSIEKHKNFLLNKVTRVMCSAMLQEAWLHNVKRTTDSSLWLLLNSLSTLNGVLYDCNHE